MYDPYFSTLEKDCMVSDFSFTIYRGENFCEAYKDSGDLVTLTEVPVLCLSATLTENVKTDRLNCLYLQTRTVKIIFLDLRKGHDFREDLGWLLEEVKNQKSETPKTVIYCRYILLR